MTINPRERLWWKENPVYQIYPASYCDSNGDGIGDLRGIVAHLDDIVATGFKTIWVCPMYQSPQVDMGYDISDYEKVHEPYGTLADMETLITAAHTKGVKVMLDLVINHTSDLHAWFVDSRSSKDNPKRDWYIWRPAKYDEQGNRQPPNNWRSNFGAGSAWEWDEHTQEYYLHLFAKEQPDLNWENDETREAIYESAIRFWLKRGVDGFRIDTVNMYSKPLGLPDAPIVDPSSPYQPAGLLYCNGPRMHEYLSQINNILSEYRAITVGELPHTPDMAKVLKYVSAEARQLDMVFQFDVVDLGMGKTHKYETVPKYFTLPDLKAAVDRTQGLLRGTDAWTTVFMENHDQARSISRFADDSPQHRVAGGRMLAMLQGCLSGTLFCYQGQEYGHINAPLDKYPLEEYLDIESLQFLQKVKAEGGDMKKAAAALQYLARDHARIPIAWDPKKLHGGFSEFAEANGLRVLPPWQREHPLASEICKKGHDQKETGVWKFWKHMLRQRQKHRELFVYGDFEVVRPSDQTLFMFTKEMQNRHAKAFVVLNFSSERVEWSVPDAKELGAEGALELVPLFGTHHAENDNYFRVCKPTDEPLEPWEGRCYMINPAIDFNFRA